MSLPRVLVFSKTVDFRHDSIPTAIQVFQQQASNYNITFDFSEDATLFTNSSLAAYDGLLFLQNTGEVLDDEQQAALATYWQSGGVYTGVHATSDCLRNSTNYQDVVGAHFDYHPTIQNAEEEIYYFKSDPRAVGATLLLSVDESSYTDDGTSTGDFTMGSPHPIAWYIESPESAQPLLANVPKAGRSFYTALGHLNSTWENPLYIQHVMSGLQWALEGASTKAYGVGVVGSDAGVSVSTSSASGSAVSTPAATGTGSSSSSVPSATSSSKTSGAERLYPFLGLILMATFLGYLFV
ncbi:uncharacterized protein P7C73_g4279, partial [Tremellales sp. Uapishka_1]